VLFRSDFYGRWFCKNGELIEIPFLGQQSMFIPRVIKYFHV